MQIGDLVEEYDPCNPQEKFPLGIVIPFPPNFRANHPHFGEDQLADIVWVNWASLGEENWSFVIELRLHSENR